ncbi:hypothetical protein [Streptomyces sp. CBMA123]|uniref:hypothetical protein n=1 Tax=Streptomyces sp. CBMA123 TaxID=1896313 RepID=UPI001661F5B5|nr:hypothetical protein [Streptomyces sp. CBMA123]
MDVEQPHAAIELPEGSWWEWDVVAWGRGQFRLAADHDLTYHHGLELVFGDPLFVNCPSYFQDPLFRVPTPEELAAAIGLLGEDPPVLVAFEADAGGTEPASCLIAADRLDIVQETVLRYWREDAAPDQRFAPWVKPSGR